MKQFIVLAAVLPIMMLLFAQFSLDRINQRHVWQAENAVREFEAQAVSSGGSSGISESGADDSAGAGGANVYAAANQLRGKLASIFGADVSQVSVDTAPGGDGFTYYYSVSVPMGKLMAGANLFSLDGAQNSGRFKAQGSFVDMKGMIDAEFAAQREALNEMMKAAGGGGDESGGDSGGEESDDESGVESGEAPGDADTPGSDGGAGDGADGGSSADGGSGTDDGRAGDSTGCEQ